MSITTDDIINYECLILHQITRLKKLKQKIENKPPELRSGKELLFLVHIDSTIKEYKRELTVRR
ncbi:MAG: hypothetical protein R6W90_07650 [Ignavibacteriaceae bacterium]